MNKKNKERIKKAWSLSENQEILKDCEREFGKYKKITSSVTGKSYEVPVRDIMTIGINGVYLLSYPEWKEDVLN